MTNWPGGCEKGRNDFLKGVGIKRKRSLFVVKEFGIHQWNGSTPWLVPDEDNPIVQTILGAVLSPKRLHLKRALYRGQESTPMLYAHADEIIFDRIELRRLTKSGLGSFVGHTAVALQFENQFGEKSRTWMVLNLDGRASLLEDSPVKNREIYV